MSKSTQYSPSSQHLDQMLLRRPRLFALSQTRKDAVLLQQRFPSSALYLEHLRLRNVAMRRNYVEVEILPQHNNTRTVLQHVSCGAVHGLDRMGLGRLVWDGRRRGRRCRNGLGNISEKLEHVLQRIGVVLRSVDIVR